MALSMNRCVTRGCLLKNAFLNRIYMPKLSYSDDFGSDSSKKRQHIETPKFPDEFSPNPPKGKIYDKKPFRMELKAGRKYAWCACGHSHRQPLCDGTHKTLWGTAERKTMPKWQPHRFKVEETKEYWVCNCKQTDNRPFCDGTHKQPHIQSAVKS